MTSHVWIQSVESLSLMLLAKAARRISYSLTSGKWRIFTCYRLAAHLVLLFS